LKYLQLFILLAIACLTAFAQPTGGESLRVASAKRAREYRNFGGRSLTAADAARDVVLVLELADVTIDEFQKLGRDDLYVMAGSRRCNPSIALSGVIDGKPQILVAVIVPRDVLKLVLFAGPGRSVTFTAPAAIRNLVE